MSRCFLSLCLVIVLIGEPGCINAAPKGKVSAERLEKLPRGITIHDAEHQLETKLIHEFSERRGTNIYQCLRFRALEPPASFYFLFANSNLVRIVIPPSFAWTNTTYRNTPAQKLLPVNPDERITATFEQADLSPSEIKSRLALNSLKGGGRTAPANAAPAFILTAPLWAALAPIAASEVKQVEAWKTKYNPLLISLGASVSEVDGVFGKPVATISENAGESIRVYGHKNPPNVPAGTPQALVAVVIKGNAVTRVLSDHFFSTTWHTLVP